MLCYFSDVTKLLLYTAQACHELVPPDVSLIRLSIDIYVILNTVCYKNKSKTKIIYISHCCLFITTYYYKNVSNEVK